jgi:hypothetical protein
MRPQLRNLISLGLLAFAVPLLLHGFGERRGDVTGFSSSAASDSGEAWNSFSSGTILVTAVSRDEAVFAADSRITLRSASGAVSHSDRECKVGVLAPLLIYAAAGKRTVPALSANDISWDSHATAERAVQIVLNGNAPAENRTVAAVAKQWETISYKFFSAQISPAQRALLDAGNAEAVFAGLDPDGHVSVVRAQVRITPVRSSSGGTNRSSSSGRANEGSRGKIRDGNRPASRFAFFSTSDSLQPCTNGGARFWADGEGKDVARAYLDRFACRPTTSGVPAMESLTIAAAQRTIDRRSAALGAGRAEVAPPIAAIAFDRSGWRWIQAGACRE